MIVYLLSKVVKNKDSNPVAICQTEDEAKAIAIDGEYIIAPVTVGQAYPTLIGDGLTGAIHYSKEGLATSVNTAKQDIEGLNSRIGEISQLLAEITRLQERQALALGDLTKRVESIEKTKGVPPFPRSS